MDEHELRTRAREWLRTRGPAAPGQLLRALEAEEDLDPPELYRLLMDESFEDGWAAFPLLDGRLCDLDALAEGVTLTHVVGADERARDAVELEPDLTFLALYADERGRVPLAGPGGGHLEIGVHELTGPPGWLPDEDVLIVRLVDGAVEVRGADDVPEVHTATAERLALTLEALRGQHHHALDEAELLLEVRARYPRLLAEPHAPFEVLLAAEDLVSTPGGVLTLAEAEEDEPDHIAELTEHLHTDHGLDEEQVDAVLHLLLETTRVEHAALQAGVEDARRRIAQDEPLDTAPVTDTERAAVRDAIAEIDIDRTAHALAVVLADVDAALALVEDVVGDDPLTAGAVLDLLDAVRPASRSRAVRANTAWVRAQALELTADDHTEVERALRDVHELDPDHGPAAFALAGFLSERGQAGAALGLLRRIEGPGVEEMVELLSDYAQPGPMSAGRNDPCPCGSGRKHKVCCAVRGGWSLADRMPWLMHKLMSFYGGPYARDVVTDVARACGLGEESDYRDVAAMNLALFEGGVIEDLCAVRGALLPADELALLRDWSQVRGELYELIERPGDGAGTLLDLRSGDRVDIVDHSLTGGLEAGTAMLAWLVPGPDGTTTPFYGVVVVPHPQREPLLDLLDEEPAATRLAVFVRDLYAPPRLATTGGDPIVSVEQTYRVPDPEAARAALAERLEEDDDGTLRGFEDRDGVRWLKGSVRLEDDLLRVQTLSTPRADWFARLVADAVPDAELVDDQRLPIADALGPEDEDAARLYDEDALGLEALSEEEGAEVEAQLATFMRQQEDAWVDSPLPALGGRSPRQALEDPTRRDEVLRLLNDVARTEEAWSGPGRGMSASRLRSLLGIS